MSCSSKSRDQILPRLSADYPSGTLGFVFLIVIMFTLGDLDTILASATGQPLPQIFLEATGNTGAAFGLFFMSKWICDITSGDDN